MDLCSQPGAPVSADFRELWPLNKTPQTWWQLQLLPHSPGAGHDTGAGGRVPVEASPGRAASSGCALRTPGVCATPYEDTSPSGPGLPPVTQRTCSPPTGLLQRDRRAWASRGGGRGQARSSVLVLEATHGEGCRCVEFICSLFLILPLQCMTDSHFLLFSLPFPATLPMTWL